MAVDPRSIPAVQPEKHASGALKYNPHLWGDAELRSIFVARKPELTLLVEALRQTDADKVPQHILITGQRGMGKSTLMRRLALEVRQDSELSRCWLALTFPEEQYTVSNFAELLRNVLDALADSLERQGDSSRDELMRLDARIALLEAKPVAEQERIAIDTLKEYIDRTKRQILLLVDSTDLLFANLAGGGKMKSDLRGTKINDAGATALWRLRRMLSHQHGLLWLGASYQALESQHYYEDTFHDFFRIVELRPLSLESMQDAMLALAETFGMAGLHGDEAALAMRRSLEARPERIRTLRAMTGGNPRTTVMLYELFAADRNGQVQSDLNGLLDSMTPLYKARMENLPEQARKILAHLMELWAPQPARELARVADIPVTTINSQLTRLDTDGLIEKVQLPGSKRKGYQVTERFFNIWYLMRCSTRRLRQGLSWLVEFMRLWYQPDELLDLACHRIAGHRVGSLGDASGLSYSRALAFALPEGSNERAMLEWTVFTEARKTRNIVRELFDMDGDDRVLLSAEEYLRRFHALEVRLRQCSVAHERDEVDLWVDAVMGSAFLGLAEKERIAEEAATIKADRYDALREKLMTESSVSAVALAVREGRFFPDCPSSEIACRQILTEFSTDREAFAVALKLYADCEHNDGWFEKVYMKAVELFPDQAWPWYNLGNLLKDHPGRYAEAEAAYRRAIEIDETNAWPWNGLGILLQVHLGRYAEAEVAYKRAIELDETNAWSWNMLGNLLQGQLGRYAEAEMAYKRAIELDETNAWPWNGLGILLQVHLGRYAEAEVAYKRAIELDETNAWPWNGLGNLLQSHLGRYTEAEAAYKRAIELDETNFRPWNGLGILFKEHLDRYAEAEVAYRRAIELDETDARAWNGLGNLQEHLGRYTEAEVAYKRAIELDETDASPWNNLGNLFQGHLGRYAEAEVTYKRAIELNETDARLWNNLGNLLQEHLGQYFEAEAAYRRAIELDENNARSWNGLGFLLQVHLGRYAESEAVYRRAIELDEKNVGSWNNLGNVLQDHLGRNAEAEAAYKRAIDLDDTDARLYINLARLYVMEGKQELALKHYRYSIALVESDNEKDDEWDILLQAHLWLGNLDAARIALDEMAVRATQDDNLHFYRLREQARECHRLGIGVKLATLMDGSLYRDFLRPFSLALRAAGPEGLDVLGAAPPEMAILAREVYEELIASPA
ncbi:MAG TPA: tetratricopeptide repeat protein [Chlorobaculum sp.]|nr:tetratricopeptide repeat protein [Chlorobaculum sp.]